MLSRRRGRRSSSSKLVYNDNISIEVNDNGAWTTERSPRIGRPLVESVSSKSETEKTSKSSLERDFRTLESSTRHVEDEDVVGSEENTGDGTIREADEYERERNTEHSHVELSKRETNSAMSTASLNRCRLIEQRVGESSRHRRRKSVEMLDRNVDVVPNSRSTKSNDEIDDFELTARINRADGRFDDNSASINPKTPDNDKISRTKDETNDARSRINFHRRVDTAMTTMETSEILDREKSTDVITSAVSFDDKEALRARNMRKILKQWACRKSRLYVFIGLLTLMALMTSEVAGRQNHHRTCPGCPHQHVHTIHRKAGGGLDERSEATSDPEAAPSPDDLRLEAIKHQILTKLGLRTRPDINRTLASVPRHLALETLYRAEAQPSGYSNEPDDYHEDRRADDRHGDNDGEDSLSSSLSSSSSSSLSSLSSSSLSSSSVSSSISSSKESSSSSSSHGQFYYDGEKYSYRNVDQGGLEKDSSSRGFENARESSESGSYFDNERHRAHGDYRNGGKARDYHAKDDNDDGQIEMDDFYARTSEIISFAEPGRTLNGQPLLEFPQSSGDPALEPLRIKRATLWARVELRHAHHYQHHRRAQLNQRNITLWVFRVRCGNVTHLRGKELGEHLEMITSLGVNVNQLGWQKFDVTKAVSNWYSGHEFTATRNEKLTLLVDCTGCGSHVYVSTFGVQAPHVVESSLNSQKDGQDPDRPFLVVRTDPAAVKRVRRRAIECSGAIKGQCCKQRFYVSFSQLGWDDWIIAPQGYYANYCRGDCAAGHRTPDTFLNYYTHVIEEYRKMDRLAGMQPCCAPLKFSPMSLIYYGPDSNIIKRDLPKMVVDECGCP